LTPKNHGFGDHVPQIFGIPYLCSIFFGDHVPLIGLGFMAASSG
jgi:hypothetical protein